MGIYVTKEDLLALNPCSPESRIKLFGRRKKLNVRQAIAAGASVQDILWVARKLGRNDLCVRFALLCAQRVAYLNPDPRVQAAIDATAAYLAAPSGKTRAAAYAAVYAAADAVYAAADAAYAAVYAAYAAVYAAYAAVYAASAADAAVYAAAYAADYAARKTAKEAEEAAQVQIALEVFK